MTNAHKKAFDRWFRRRRDDFEPIPVTCDMEFGEDLERTPMGRHQFEYLAERGPLEPDEELPSDDECRRLFVDFARRPAISRAELLAVSLPPSWYEALLDQEQEASDAFAARRRRD